MSKFDFADAQQNWCSKWIPGALLLPTLLLVASFFVQAQETSVPGTCSYSTYKWNVNSKRAVEYRHVSHPYMELEKFEIDVGTGCTVCKEDQVIIKIPGTQPFMMCKHLARRIRSVLVDSQKNGFPLWKLIGYRVGMTRGDVDADGNRTGFSNHSFGIAIDINENLNGLYGNCFSFGDQCTLRRGGVWNPEVPGTLKIESELVQDMKNLGLKWGGEIAGRQKDFMHFSPTGY